MENFRAHARSMFNSVYPGCQIKGIHMITDDEAVLDADLPGDGRFYFVVTDNSISPSYDSFDEAKSAIEDNFER